MFVRLGRDQCAIKRFDSLGFREWRLQRPGDVEGDVLRSDRHHVGADELTIGEQADGRRAGADVDDGDAELDALRAW